MIVKVLARHSPSYGSLIDYLTKEGKGKDGKPIVITHNFKGTTKEEWVQEFIENEAFRQHVRSNQIYLYHEILSLSPDEPADLVTDEVLEDLARAYIQFRGENGQYIAAIHRDTEHPHIHLAVSGLEYRTGLAHRLSKAELHDLKVQFQEYHKGHYPFLTHSNPEHGSGKDYMTDAEYWSKKRTNDKAEIKEQVHKLFEEATSRQHFLELLRDNNMPHYERGETITGVMVGETKHRFSRLDINLSTKEPDPVFTQEQQQILSEIETLRQSGIEINRDIEWEI